MDYMEEWTFLPMTELLTMTSGEKTFRKICAESSTVFSPRPDGWKYRSEVKYNRKPVSTNAQGTEKKVRTNR